VGVSRLIPLSTERAVAEANANALSRLGRGVIEASKQSGRNRLLTIAAPLTWTKLITGAASPGVTRAVADTQGATHVRTLLEDARLAGPAHGFEFAVGPEGGLTDAELELARTCGWHLVGMGPRVLRVETAAICLAAMAAALAPVSSSEFIPSRQEQNSPRRHGVLEN
jgi:16S rRNA (uracil1498-N3)-methyltransferase